LGRLPPDEYPIYAPPLIVEVLLPSNTPAKVNRQRIVALSAGYGLQWVKGLFLRRSLASAVVRDAAILLDRIFSAL
jgi:hypothetical protein